jgi:hypothetical protein
VKPRCRRRKRRRSWRTAVAGALRARNTITDRYHVRRRSGGRLSTVGYIHSLWFRHSDSGRSSSSKGRVDILAEFETGATITPQRAKLIYVLPPAKGKFLRSAGCKRLRVSPRLFEARTGLKFRRVKVGSRAFLVADQARLSGSRQVARVFEGGSRTKTGRLKRGAATVFLFQIANQTRLPKRRDLGQVKVKAGEVLARWVLVGGKRKPR